MTTRGNSERGFSLIELMMVVGILGTVAAMAVMVGSGFVRQAKADAGIEQAVACLRNAREVAITERRNVQVVFNGTDGLQAVRENLPVGAGTTVLSTVRLENRMQFLLANGVPDTPDAFGNAAAIAFGPSPTRMFTSEGTFVDSNGDVLNGTLFLANSEVPNSARAITIFGTTALLRVWRWNGAAWVE